MIVSAVYSVGRTVRRHIKRDRFLLYPDIFRWISGRNLQWGLFSSGAACQSALINDYKWRPYQLQIKDWAPWDFLRHDWPIYSVGTVQRVVNIRGRARAMKHDNQPTDFRLSVYRRLFEVVSFLFEKVSMYNIRLVSPRQRRRVVQPSYAVTVKQGEGAEWRQFTTHWSDCTGWYKNVLAVIKRVRNRFSTKLSFFFKADDSGRLSRPLPLFTLFSDSFKDSPLQRVSRMPLPTKFDTQYTIHNTPYTVHSTPYTVHSREYTVHSREYRIWYLKLF